MFDGSLSIEVTVVSLSHPEYTEKYSIYYCYIEMNGNIDKRTAERREREQLRATVKAEKSEQGVMLHNIGSGEAKNSSVKMAPLYRRRRVGHCCRNDFSMKPSASKDTGGFVLTMAFVFFFYYCYRGADGVTTRKKICCRCSQPYWPKPREPLLSNPYIV